MLLHPTGGAHKCTNIKIFPLPLLFWKLIRFSESVLFLFVVGSLPTVCERGVAVLCLNKSSLVVRSRPFFFVNEVGSVLVVFVSYSLLY